MVIGDYTRCIECNHEYRIRYNVGNSFPQKATFKCKTCGNYLEYGMDGSHKQILAGLESIEHTESATIQNLHPELPIDAGKEHDPYYFPSVDFMSEYWTKNPQDESGSAFRAEQRSIVNFKTQLDSILSDFRYLKEKRWNHLESKYGKNHKKTERTILKKSLAIGRSFMVGKWELIYRDSLSQFELAKRQPNFNLLKQFLDTKKDEFLIEKMYDLFQAYSRVYHELLPTLLKQKCGMTTDGISSSANWEKLEMVYGGFYEAYGDLLVIPTAINNLLSRGDFKIFATAGFDIAAYEKTDKAGRANNLATNVKLKDLADFYDAGLRNGTYHKGSSISNDDQQITLKTGKGGGTPRAITLIEYIVNCNELFARCLIILNIMYKATHN